jgi:hypothetical protein
MLGACLLSTFDGSFVAAKLVQWAQTGIAPAAIRLEVHEHRQREVEGNFNYSKKGHN